METFCVIFRAVFLSIQYLEVLNVYFVFTEKRKCFYRFFISQSPNHICLAANSRFLESFSLQPEPTATGKSSLNSLPCLYLKKEGNGDRSFQTLASCCFWCSGQFRIHAVHLWTLDRGSCRPLTVPAVKTDIFCLSLCFAGLTVSVPGMEKALHQYTLEPSDKPFDMKTVPLATAPIFEQKAGSAEASFK